MAVWIILPEASKKRKTGDRPSLRLHKKKTPAPDRGGTENVSRSALVQYPGQGLIDEEAQPHVDQPLHQGKGHVED